MAEEMDTFIKSSLQARYKIVVERLQEYKGAIEEIVRLLYKKENITGEEVRNIIIHFEKENGLTSKVNIVVDDIEEELKTDAAMAQEAQRGEADEK
jgi:cell division protease FtsH